MNAKKLLNDPANCVHEMLEGLVLSNSARLVKLEGYNVIVRADISIVKNEQVTVLTGGGSGHEPFASGYVGDGFLTAAVAGGVFASPSAAAVLAGIRAVCGPPGLLVVVMNYTGDRLNFGMAVERAKAEGLNVKMVVVADDCALPPGKGITGRRGVAGTVLVGKVACAAAASGCSLGQVEAEALQAIAATGSLGVALTVCTLPGAPINERLDSETIEIGLGIHGEPGITQSKLLPADELTDRMILAILGAGGGEGGGSDADAGHLAVTRGQSVVCMVNSLGATPPMELLLVVRRALLNLAGRGLKAVRCYSGSFMTSLDMAGVSVSIMVVDPLRLARLDAFTSGTAWGDASISRLPLGDVDQVALSLSRAVSAQSASAKTGEMSLQRQGSEWGPVTVGADSDRVSAVIEAVAAALVKAEHQLQEWDRVAGDGDCGASFRRGAEGLLTDLNKGGEKLPLDDLEGLLRGLSESVSAMGGTSGAIIEIFFCAGQAVTHSKGMSTTWLDIFSAGVEAVVLYGGASIGMKTMVDALMPACNAWNEYAIMTAATPTAVPGGEVGSGWKEGVRVSVEGFRRAVVAAEKGADATLGMAAKAGRANYVAEDVAKSVPDPGAKAVALIMRAVLSALTD